MPIRFDMEPTLYVGSSLDVLPTLRANSVDAIVSDPPYELGFMSKGWDATGIAYSVDLWAECLRVLKPGGYLLSFGGTRTFHRMAVAIEDAGFDVVDTLHFCYGSGFPKSLSIGKALDKAAGAEREVIERRRVKSGGMESLNRANAEQHSYRPDGYQKGENILDITAPATDDARQWEGWGTALKPSHEPIVVAVKPGASPFMDLAELNVRGSSLYFPKANKKERPVVNGVSHATVKPLALMRYLVTIACPEGGVVLDPFAGSGTTMEAAVLEGRQAIGVELTLEHVPLIEFRMERQGVELVVQS